MLGSKIKTLLLATAAVGLAISLILFPEEALEASIRGLNTWWKVVFPSLLPFFIIAELLIGFGIVKFLGVLLEPLMRPLFRVPGVGGFVWAMGLASGNPAGAKLTTHMRKEAQISQIEGERLVAFTSGASPLFIFGAVSVGFFYNASLGIIFGIAHYVGNIFVGFVMRFYGKDDIRKNDSSAFSLKEAFRVLHQTRINDKRPIGKLLGDAVISSIHTLLMIGGFIILFSVINRLLTILYITDFFAIIVSSLFSLINIPGSLSIPFISGLFEMTIGSQMISEIKNVSLLQQAIVVSFLLAFGGFSIQAQVASLLSQTDIRFLPFFIARILHGIFAALITLIIWQPIYVDRLSGQNFKSHPVVSYMDEKGLSSLFQLITEFGPIITLVSLIVYIIVYSKRLFIVK